MISHRAENAALRSQVNEISVLKARLDALDAPRATSMNCAANPAV